LYPYCEWDMNPIILTCILKITHIIWMIQCHVWRKWPDFWVKTNSFLCVYDPSKQCLVALWNHPLSLFFLHWF
jgi:hypothetical protein